MPKCYFQDDWLKMHSWIRRVPDQTDKAYCILCVKTFSLSNMGLRAVTSHKEGKKHCQMEKTASSSINVGSFFSPTSSKNIPVEPEPVQDHVAAAVEKIDEKRPNVNSLLDKFVLKDNVTRTEIIWCIQTILSHKSLRSAEKDVMVFSNMFPDSDIAKNLQLSRTKMAYVIVHGLSPLFHQILLDEVTVMEHVVIGFDESLNKITQKQQMDLNVRFWDRKLNLVKTCYLTSIFLGRTCAGDLLAGFQTAVENFNLKSLLQISMDGPNVNFKFLSELQKSIKETPDDPEILTIGSCGLHALNVAFKTGAKASGWSIFEFFRSLYYVFKDSPARRAMYIALTKSTVFPKKFCSVRWLENSSVALRALEIIPFLKTFVQGLESAKMAPNSKSYGVVKESLKDELLPAKICFFHIISGDIEGFLREYQSDIPLIPFLYSDLTAVVKGLMERFIQKNVFRDTSDILDIDVNDNENLIAVKNVDIGISTTSIVRKAKIQEKDVTTFRKECRQFLIKCVMKLQERSPLKYSLTKAVSCFDPFVAVNYSSFSKRLGQLLLILITKKWITPLEAEHAKKQLKDICSRKDVVEKLRCYKRYGVEKGDCRLDKFWFNILNSENCSKQAQKILKMVMILSHGNANVERGFSINSDCLWENMKEESIVARRRVYDYVTMKGGVSKLEITRQMIQYVRNARARYSEAQETERKKDRDRETLLKRKRDASIHLKELEAKKAKILKEAEKERLLIEDEINAIRFIQKSSI